MNNYTPAGNWFLEANGSRLELNILEVNDRYTGVITDEDGYSEIISNISWDSQDGSLDFWWDSVGEWCRAYVADRVAETASEPPDTPSASDVPRVSDLPSAQSIPGAPSPGDAALYELAAALSPVFASLPREAGATGAKFGNFLFSIREAGPCCPVNPNARRWAAVHETFDNETEAGSHASGGPGVSRSDRRCA